MVRPHCLWLALVVAGCASGPSAGNPAANGGDSDDRLSELWQNQNEQSQRIAELEARLKLLEEDARRARGPTTRPSATVRIGETESHPEPNESYELASAPAPSNLPSGSERRPNVKLHGRPRAARSGGSDGELPPLPVTSETLSVVPLPQDRSRARQAEAQAAAVSDPATSSYRAALGLLRERRFEEAALALSNWVSDNPDHALLDRAMYWLAEVRYASRDYRRALAGFEKVLERFPNSEKTPDTLYKLGMCWRRLGSEDQARAYFRRLRAEFPNSEAAGLASREGST